MYSVKEILESMIRGQKTKNPSIQSSSEMLVQIKETEVLECGCCYKLSAPALDMLAIELGFLRTFHTRVKAICDGELVDSTKSKEENIKQMSEATDAATKAVFKYIISILQMEVAFGISLYTKAMNNHRDKYRKDHPEHPHTCFDNLLDIQDFMDKAIKAKAEGKTDDQIMNDLISKPSSELDINKLINDFFGRREPKSYL